MGSMQLTLSSVKGDFPVFIAFDKTRHVLPSSTPDLV